MFPGPLHGPIEPTGPSPQNEVLRKTSGRSSQPFDQVLARTVARSDRSRGTDASPPDSSTRAVHLSAHARQRLSQQGIVHDASWLEKIGGAIDRAAAKGSRDTLIMTGSVGLIVHVENRTVVTAIERSRMSEGLVTGIDSTVFLDPTP